MKVLVISDSHGKTKNIHQVISKEKDVDAIVHLGDMFSDFLEIRDCYDIPSYGVVGNIDYDQNGPSFDLIDINGYKVFICHGHNYSVNYSLDMVKYKASTLSADVILFGHSHVSYLETEGTFIMNPGSISEPRSEKCPSYGILEVKDHGIDGKIVFIC